MLSKENDAVANSSLFTLHSSLPKSERIVSKKLIDQLFTSDQNHSLAAFPLRAVYLEAPTDTLPAQKARILISVSKRHFKHAVDRNRVKRQLREAYRLNRPLLTDHIPDGCQVNLAFIWLSDSHAPSSVVASRMKRLLKRIAGQISDSHPFTPNP